VTKDTKLDTLAAVMNEKRFPSTKTRVEEFLTVAANRTGELIGLKTGFPELDIRLDGLQPGVIALGGRSHHGKTMTFINLMLGILSHNPKTKIVYFSIDDSASMIINRLLSNESSQSINDVNFPRRVKANKPEKYDNYYKKMLEGVEKLVGKSDNLQIIDAADMVDYDDIVEEIMSSNGDLEDDENLVVFIDNFHKIRNNKFTDEVKSVMHMSNGLKELSTKINIPIVMTTEFKKTGTYGRPAVDDIKNSNCLQYDATVIILVHNEYHSAGGKTDAVYQTGDINNPIYNPVIELHLVKNKGGSSHGFVYYAFFGWKAQIKELDKVSYEGYTMIINNSKGGM